MTTPHKINRKPHKKKLHKNAMTKPHITGYAWFMAKNSSLFCHVIRWLYDLILIHIIRTCAYAL